MAQNITFQPKDLFRQQLLGFVDDLKDAQEKLLRSGKMTPKILRDVSYVRAGFRFLREAKDGHGRQLIYGSLFGDPHYIEAFNVIEACWSKADEALADAEKSKDSEWFGGRLNQTINRLIGICEDLRKSGRDVDTGEEIGPTPPAPSPEKQSDKIVALKSFMNTYCDIGTGAAKVDISSKVDLLHQYNRNRNKNLALPKLACKYKRGRQKRYYANALIEIWPALVDIVPTLPPLKCKDSSG